MGKSGQALREAKRQAVSYTFTREQLAAHDILVRDEYRKIWFSEMEKRVAEENKKLQEEANRQYEEANRRVEAEWRERERRFMSSSTANNFYHYVACFMAVSIRVLIEQFGWKPLVGRNWQLTRIKKFSDAVRSEIDKIAADEMTDIRRYAEETTAMYGLGFGIEEDDDGENE